MHYARQPIALVVADTLERAVHAAALVSPRYDGAAPQVELEHHEDQAVAPKPSGPADAQPGIFQRGERRARPGQRGRARRGHLHDALRDPQPHGAARHGGDVARGIASRSTTRRRHLRGAPQGLRLVRAGQGARPRHLPLPRRRLRVQGSVWSHVILAAMAARMLGRPVRWCCPGRRCSASSAAGPTRSSAWRSPPPPTARSRRSATTACRRRRPSTSSSST